MDFYSIRTLHLSSWGGGLAVVCKNRFSCPLVSTEPFTIFFTTIETTTQVGELKFSVF